MKVHLKDGRVIDSKNTLVDGGQGIIAFQKKQDRLTTGMGVSLTDISSIEISGAIFVPVEATAFVTEAAVRYFVLNLQARTPALSMSQQLEELIEFQKRTDTALTDEARDYLTRQINALKESVSQTA